MKFEVIGWMSYDDVSSYPLHRGDWGSVTRAVVKAVREGGYKFGGNTQDDAPSGLPVLNDGTMASFSWRGWGGVMAEALRLPDEDGMAYMEYYMDHPDPETGKLPEIVLPPRGVDESRIVKRETLAEEFELSLSPAAFEALLSGKKRVEMRVWNREIGLICRDDRILFSCGEQTCRTRVKEIEPFFDPPEFFGLKEPVFPVSDKERRHHVRLVQGALAAKETPEQLCARLVGELPQGTVEALQTECIAISFERI